MKKILEQLYSEIIIKIEFILEVLIYNRSNYEVT